MWLKKLKKKKFQFIVIGLILLFGTTILTCCTNIVLEVEKITNNLYNSKTHEDFFVFASKGTSEVLKDSVDNLKTIKAYKATDDCDVFHDKETILDIQDETYIVVLDDYKKVDWIIDPIEGAKDSNGPKPGEVWVQKIIADAHDIKIGDTYVIDNDNKDELKVTSLINDSLKPNSMSNAQLVYINEEDYNKFKGNEEVDFMVIDSSMNNDELNEIIDNKFSADMKLYNIRNYKDLQDAANRINNLVAGLGIISAIFMLAVTIIIIRFFIRSTIFSEYFAIGTYKAVGFTNKEIINFYNRCYVLVGLISCIIGAMLGIPASKFMGNIILEYITDYRITFKSVVIAIVMAVITFVILYFNVFIALRKIKKITPVDAFRIGVTSSKAKIKKSLIKNAQSSLAVAINDIFKNKGKSVLTILVISVAFYVCLVFLNMCYSFDTLDDKASAWVGSPTSHCCIESKNKVVEDEIFEYLDNSKYVDKYVYGSLYFPGTVESLEESINLKTVWTMVFNTYNSEDYNINYAEGRPPKNKHEIGIDSTSILNGDLEVGDYIKLKINGKEDEFLITGTFDTVGGSQGIHLLNSYFNNKEEYLNSVPVLLKDKKDLEDFKKDLKDKFPDYEIKNISDYIGDVKNSIQAIMVPITIIIIVVFIMFTLLNIINLIVMNYKEQQRNYGIMKAYGFTTGYIIRKNFFRIGILAVVGLTISVVCNRIFTAKIFWKGLGCDGYNITQLYSSIFIIGGFLSIMIITGVLCYRIKKISPKELIEE